MNNTVAWFKLTQLTRHMESGNSIFWSFKRPPLTQKSLPTAYHDTTSIQVWRVKRQPLQGHYGLQHGHSLVIRATNVGNFASNVLNLLGTSQSTILPAQATQWWRQSTHLIWTKHPVTAGRMRRHPHGTTAVRITCRYQEDILWYGLARREWEGSEGTRKIGVNGSTSAFKQQKHNTRHHTATGRSFRVILCFQHLRMRFRRYMYFKVKWLK